MLTRRRRPAAQSPNCGFGIGFPRTKKKRAVEFASGLFCLENTKLQAAASQPPREASAVASAEKAGGPSTGESRSLWAPPLLVWLWCWVPGLPLASAPPGRAWSPPAAGWPRAPRGTHPPPPGPGFSRCWWERGVCGSPLRATRAGICLLVSAARTRVRGLRLSVFLNLSQGKGLLADVTKAMALLPPKISTHCTLFPGVIVILTSRRGSSLKSWPSVRDPHLSRHGTSEVPSLSTALIFFSPC